MDDMTTLTVMHRQEGPSLDRAVAGLVDRHALFASVTQTLFEDRQKELVRLFYELGKAYVLAAHKKESDSAGSRRTRSVQTVTAPLPIRSTTDQARRLSKEVDDLAFHGAEISPRGVADCSSTKLLSHPGESGGLARGRRLLEQALDLCPEFTAARLYLGFQRMQSGRYDRARIEFRRVYRHAEDPVHRMMALQWLGVVYSTLGHMSSCRDEYMRAIRCYTEVVASGVVDKEPRLFISYLNLAVNCAKVGLVHRSLKHFDELIHRFPDRIDQSRDLLAKMEDFRGLLRDKAQLREDLTAGCPALFAA